MGHQKLLVQVVEVRTLTSFSLIEGIIDSERVLCTAGANLMGSDLYNNLIRYFITHLKTLRDVIMNPVRSRSSIHDAICFSNRTPSRMRRSYATTLQNGIVTQPAQTISIDYSHISIDIGSNASEMRAEKVFILSTRYVIEDPIQCQAAHN